VTGDVLPDWTLDAVDPEKMKVLALLLADPNPLHFAASPPVNQGPSNMAMLVNLLRQAYPQGRLRRLTVQLRGSVVAGDAVRARGRVTDRRRDGGTETLTCEVALEVDGGRTVLTGEAEIDV
jgi:3-hydroxybutyryl-CoA dehydratase